MTVKNQTSSRHAPAKPSESGNADRGSDPFALPARVAVATVALTLPVLLGVIVWTAEPARPTEMERMVAAASAGPAVLYEGQQLYHKTCAACHGADGRGLVPLGKPLRNGRFMREADDAALFDLIANGRMPKDPLNTTGALMPARGAQGLTDEQVRSVIAYTRTMQDPAAPVADQSAWDIVPAGSGPAAVALAPGGIDASTLPGHDLFIASCSACHGPDAKGMAGVGVTLIGSDWVNGRSDKELLAFIKTGRPIWDAESKTGVDMPPKGGNPALDDDQLGGIIAYIRALNGGSGSE